MNRSWGADPPVAQVGHSYLCAGPAAGLASPEPRVAAGGSRGADPSPIDTGGVPVVTDAQHHKLADELAPMVELWERLLTLHRPDRNGRCRTCTQGGTGLPGTPWPCALRRIAELAQRRHARLRRV